MQTYPTGYAESHRIAEQIFREILPRHGMAVREEQIALCHEILDTLYGTIGSIVCLFKTLEIVRNVSYYAFGSHAAILP